MRIKIQHFKVAERYVLRTDTNIFLHLWNLITGKEDDHLYHFDCVMRVDPDYKDAARQLEINDFVELPNKIRLRVWSVDRGNIIRAKTYKMIYQDLRRYTPIEMYLVYPRVHGHLNG
jgi:hypothetical protein